MRQCHALAIVGRHRQARQQRQLGAFLRRTAQQNLDQLVVFAVLADRGAQQRALQKARQVGRAHTQGPCPVLINIEVHHLARFFPVQVHIDHMGVIANLGRHLARQRPHLFDMLAGDPELHRIAHRRTVFQARYP